MADRGHRPPGMTQSEFGLRLWGRGRPDAERRWHTISRNELVEIGLECEMARFWREFYREELLRGRGGDTAEPRMRLMEKCMALLEC